MSYGLRVIKIVKKLSEEKKHKIFTATDIEKYHKGLLSVKEMHGLEKAALDDPFLADALEGFGTGTANVTTDLSELEKKLQERLGRGKVVPMQRRQNQGRWWRIAAAVVLVGGVGFLTFKLSSNRNEKPLATSEKKKPVPGATGVVGDSNKSITPESTSIANTNRVADTKTTTAEVKTAAAKPSKKLVDSTEVAAADLTSEVGKLKYSQQKNDSLAETKNEEVVAAPRAQAKKAEVNNAQQGVALAEKQDVSKGQEKMNYFRGRIVDRNNNPLPFANITNTRDNVGTYSDAQGNFTLISTDTLLKVQVRSVGFENNLAQLKNSVATNRVVMEDDKTAPDKILSLRKAVGIPSPGANVKLEEPEPADGWINYNTYMANNINVPDDLKMKNDKGQVRLSFDVNQNGEPVDIKVEKSLCERCDEEAVRLIREGPKWKKKSKKAKRVTLTVPFDTDR